MKDYRGLEITVSNETALGYFETAIGQVLSHDGDPLATIDSAIAADPRFILAYCLRAHLGCVMTDTQGREQARESIVQSETLAEKSHPREQGHMTAIRYWIEGHFDQAASTLGNILEEYPRDILALWAVHLHDFFRGDHHNLYHRVSNVLPDYSANDLEYGYLLGMQAFGLEECRHYKLAEQVGRKAVEIHPGDVWAIHAVAHVMEMQHRQDQGIGWYESRRDDWSGDKGLVIHNWWHLALFYLERQQHDRVLEMYDEQIAGGMTTLEWLDASSLLWRLHLRGIDTGSRWEELTDKWQSGSSLDGYYCFNDVHGVMAFVGSHRFDLADKTIQQLKQAATHDNDSARMIRHVGLPVSEALVAFGKGHHAECIARMQTVLPHAHQFGGSHAQRDFITQTIRQAIADSSK